MHVAKDSDLAEQILRLARKCNALEILAQFKDETQFIGAFRTLLDRVIFEANFITKEGEIVGRILAGDEMARRLIREPRPHKFLSDRQRKIIFDLGLILCPPGRAA
jgi:hypothetical protein